MEIFVDSKQRRLAWGQVSVRCAIGRGGSVRDKVEGDGATPLGRFALRCLLYRGDRMAPPATGLPLRALAKNDGWCDAPGDANYNRAITLPYAARHEQLWRSDHLYDLLIVLGHNDAPVRPGQGSAIFFHLAQDDYGPTDGCVAISAEDFLPLLAQCDPASVMKIF